MIKAVKLKIFGQVQGVGYRYFCVRQAQIFGLHGYVRNMSDYSVEVEAEGDKDSLDDFIDRLKSGPSHADVEKIETEWSAALGKFSDFYIIP